MNPDCRLQVMPLRSAFATGERVKLPVLIQVDADRCEAAGRRPDLDLALVLDRSGSMQGERIVNARRAACAAIVSLRDSDRVAIVTYDDQVDVLVPLQHVHDKQRVAGLLDWVTPRGSTALFAGWEEGARQLGVGGPSWPDGSLPAATGEPTGRVAQTEAESGDGKRLGRVILLTDGEANVGPREPDEVSSQVARAARKGVQTTTLGFGDGYNENLLRAMAAAGSGNHYFVERAGQLGDVFSVELAGLEATLGSSVMLELVEPAPGLELEFLDQAPPAQGSGWRLPNLTAGCATQLMVELCLADGRNPQQVRFRLSWIQPRTGLRVSREVVLSLPQVAIQEWNNLPVDTRVQEHLAMCRSARLQSEAAALLREGRTNRAVAALNSALAQLREVSSPETRALAREVRSLVDRVHAGSSAGAAKSIAASRHGGHGMYNTVLHRLMAKHRQLAGLVSRGSLAVCLDKLQLPNRYEPDEKPPISRVRAAGMLLGTVAPDLLRDPTAQPSSGTRSTFRALAVMTERCWFEPEEVAEALAVEPGDYRTKLKSRGLPWIEIGEERSDDAALARLPALVLPGSGDFGALPLDAALYVSLTHHDGAAVSSAVALAGMLSELLHAKAPPEPSWWWERYAELAAPWEANTMYESRGWRGTLSSFVTEQLPRAYRPGFARRRWTVARAAEKWGRGGLLIETVPVLLYLLACHALNPAEALTRALQDVGNPTVVALVGAAVGALHGADRLPRSWMDAPALAWEHGGCSLRGIMADALDVFTAAQVPVGHCA